MAEDKKYIPKDIKLSGLSNLSNQKYFYTEEREELYSPRTTRDFFDKGTVSETKPVVEGDTKMVWMNESAVVTPDSEAPVVGTRSLKDCLGIGVSTDGVAGADHMRFEQTNDPEGDNIGYAYGRVILLVREVLDKGGDKASLYLVNITPRIRGVERNERLRRTIENAIKDERIKDRLDRVEWIDNAGGFKIDSRTGKFTKW